MSLSPEELRRYSRQIALKDIGEQGQRQLKKSRVGVIGVGGLGCFSAIQLAAMGVGSLTLVDQDVVDLTNLHRQILYDTSNVGYPKVEIAQKRLQALNPHLAIEALPITINETTASAVVKNVDVVIDGLDRLQPRYAINKACREHNVPYIYAGALETYGNVSTILPGETACLECYLGTVNDAGLPTCETTGVLTPILAIIASIQVSEAIHLLLGREPALRGKVLFIDVNSLSFTHLKIQRREDCRVCGTAVEHASYTAVDTKVVALCGKDSFMASPHHPLEINLSEAIKLLQKHYTIHLRSDLGLALMTPTGISINLMKSGNALLKGVTTEEDAQTTYTQLLNHLAPLQSH
jgi:molybdopterin/thiamine biosynthesis adenylyltransferase